MPSREVKKNYLHYKETGLGSDEFLERHEGGEHNLEKVHSQWTPEVFKGDVINDDWFFLVCHNCQAKSKRFEEIT